MQDELDQGGISKLQAGHNADETVVVQVLEIERKHVWEGVVQDGDGMKTLVKFARQLEEKLEDGIVDVFALIKITTWMNPPGGVKAVLVLNFDVIKSGSSVGGFITIQKTQTPATKVKEVPIVTKTPVQRVDNQRLTPIAGLNPYQNRWTMKARLTTKGDIITWSNARGSGELMKLTFTDAAGDDIEAVLFKEAVAKWRPLLTEDSVYIVSGGRIKAKNRQYSHTSSNYEITLDTSSRIEETVEDGSIAKTSFAFQTISQVMDAPENTVLDVIAILKSFDDPREVVSTKLGGRTLHKRELILVDEAGIEINLTLWGDTAKTEPPQAGVVLAFKGVKVTDYNGKSISILRSSKMIQTDPKEDDRAGALYTWYHTEGGSQLQTTSASTKNTTINLSQDQQQDAFYANTMQARDCIYKIKNEPHLGVEKAEYLTLKCTVQNIKTDKLWYEACPTCQRKVIEQSDSTYACEKCNSVLPHCERRFLLNFSAMDDTASQWFSAFNETALAIFGGTTADELCATFEESEATFEDLINSKKYQQLLIRCRCKQETYNEQSRLKVTAVAAAPLDYIRESAAIIQDLKLLLNN